MAFGNPPSRSGAVAPDSYPWGGQCPVATRSFPPRRVVELRAEVMGCPIYDSCALPDFLRPCSIGALYRSLIASVAFHLRRDRRPAGALLLYLLARIA